MKKLICILIALLLTFCLIGCEKNKADENAFNSKETSGGGSQMQETTETTDGSGETDGGNPETDGGETTDDTDENSGWTNIY